MDIKSLLYTILPALGAVLFVILVNMYQIKFGSQNEPKMPPNPEEMLPPSKSPLYAFQHAAICSDASACSAIGRKILERGGSVVDASLSVLLCNGLVGMQSMGLGGGMLMNIYMHDERKSYSILSREIAPMSLHAKDFLKFKTEEQFKKTGWSIAVPTELMGYAFAHERFGKLPWHELVKPTVELCRNGYRLYKHQRDALYFNKQMIMQDSMLQAMFVSPITGDFWQTGTLIHPPEQLCNTYTTIAEQGPRSFYTGTLLKMVHADLRDIGSPIKEEDLAKATVKVRSSIILPLNEYDLHLTPPPGSGYVLGFIMNILNKFRHDFEKSKVFGPLDFHRIVEAMKFGFVKRWELDEYADEQLMENLTSLAFAESIAHLINDTKTFNDLEHYGGSSKIKSREEQGTSHISVLYNDDAVSVTSSINYYFGSGHMGKRTGILFNNGMSDFSMKQLRNYFQLPFMPNKNIIRGGARPMSSMSPVIVTDRSTGKVRLVVGAAGGTKIISALVLLLVRTLWSRTNIKAALDGNRVHHQMLPNILEYEYGLLQSYVDYLQSNGHQCERYRNRGSIICGVEKINGTVFVNSDYRRSGGISGF